MSKEVEFTFEGDRRGVLLVHGLTGSPDEMRLLGKGLNRAGFTVHGVQLAGHCGTGDDLIATTWQDWYRSVEYAAERLRERCDHVFVGGLSVGALLALHLAARRPELVAGLGVFGATFRYDGWSVPRRARLAFVLPWLKKLNLARGRRFVEEPPYGIRDERLRAAMLKSMHDGDGAPPGNPWHALAEMVMLASTVRGELPRVRAPCLVAHATDDDVASVGNAYLVRDRVSGPVQMLLLDDSYHRITIDRERRQLIAAATDFFARIAAMPLRDAA
jgi:carboxylesterase